MDVPLHPPQLAPLAHRGVADDAVAVADDQRVPLEVELRPLGLQIGLRERRLPVQRRLECEDDLGHGRRVGGDGRGGDGTVHIRGTLPAFSYICSGHTFRGATHRERAGSRGRRARARRGGGDRGVRLGTRWPGGRGRRAGRLRVREPDRPARREPGAEPLARRAARGPARGRRARHARPRDGRPAHRARDAHRLGVGARAGDRDRSAFDPACRGRCAGRATTARRSIASARRSCPGASTPCERPSGPAACASRTPAVIRAVAR